MPARLLPDPNLERSLLPEYAFEGDDERQQVAISSMFLRHLLEREQRRADAHLRKVLCAMQECLETSPIH
jgi:hypothetical protein